VGDDITHCTLTAHSLHTRCTHCSADKVGDDIADTPEKKAK
jgi:hypothetical protein